MTMTMICEWHQLDEDSWAQLKPCSTGVQLTVFHGKREVLDQTYSTQAEADAGVQSLIDALN